MYDEPLRPDPDQLLAQVTERPRGKLKIFFGACAGVGKNLRHAERAQRLREQGIDVLAGWWKPTAAVKPLPCWKGCASHRR